MKYDITERKSLYIFTPWVVEFDAPLRKLQFCVGVFPVLIHIVLLPLVERELVGVGVVHVGQGHPEGLFGHQVSAER